MISIVIALLAASSLANPIFNPPGDENQTCGGFLNKKCKPGLFCLIDSSDPTLSDASGICVVEPKSPVNFPCVSDTDCERGLVCDFPIVKCPSTETQCIFVKQGKCKKAGSETFQTGGAGASCLSNNHCQQGLTCVFPNIHCSGVDGTICLFTESGTCSTASI